MTAQLPGPGIGVPGQDGSAAGKTLEQTLFEVKRVIVGQDRLVERLLVALEAELAGFHLEYQAEAAATQIGWLHVAGRRLDRYETAAERIGSRNWQPVVAMAESALDAGRQDLAVAVYRAADQPGFHQSQLRQRCLQLTGVDLAANRELRIVR